MFVDWMRRYPGADYTKDARILTIVTREMHKRLEDQAKALPEGTLKGF